MRVTDNESSKLGTCTKSSELSKKQSQGDLLLLKKKLKLNNMAAVYPHFVESDYKYSVDARFKDDFPCGFDFPELHFHKAPSLELSMKLEDTDCSTIPGRQRAKVTKRRKSSSAEVLPFPSDHFLNNVHSSEFGLFGDNLQCMPFIELMDNRWCMICGLEMPLEKSQCCKKCEHLTSNKTSKRMANNDLEFLCSLKDEMPKLKKRKRKDTVAVKLSTKAQMKAAKVGNSKLGKKNIAKADVRSVQKQIDTNSSSRRRRRHDEWTTKEIVILLQCTRLLIDCELKCVSQALYHFIARKPGKCFGRAAEKKLKRLEVFENWRKSDKEDIMKRVDELLKELGATDIPDDIKTYCHRLQAKSLTR